MKKREWELLVEERVLNKKIVGVKYMPSKDAWDMGWQQRCVMFKLDDGTWLMPQCDDEGNDAGALWHSGKTPEQQTVFPTLNTRDLEDVLDERV